MAIIEAQHVGMNYGSKEALSDITNIFEEGRLTLINGESGSGKSTLLNILAGLERPTSGLVLFRGAFNTALYSDEKLTLWRGSHTGNVFQSHGLLGGQTVGENISLPHRLRGVQLEAGWLLSLVSELGIEDLLKKRPVELSGGQRQRVAIARALAHKPEVVFADEPTASLDEENKHRVHEILTNLINKFGVSVVMSSHDKISEQYAHSVVTLKDGCVQNA